MNKRLLLTAIVASVVQFLLGFLVYGLLLAKFMDAHTTHFEGLMKDMNSPSFIVLIYLSGLVMMSLLSFIFQRWGKFKKISDGLAAGMFFGFLVSLSYDLSSYSMMNLVSATALVVDVICATVITGIDGAVITWLLWRGKIGEQVTQ